jgi:hypothetical protein
MSSDTETDIDSDEEIVDAITLNLESVSYPKNEVMNKSLELYLLRHDVNLIQEMRTRLLRELTIRAHIINMINSEKNNPDSLKDKLKSLPEVDMSLGETITDIVNKILENNNAITLLNNEYIILVNELGILQFRSHVVKRVVRVR